MSHLPTDESDDARLVRAAWAAYEAKRLRIASERREAWRSRFWVWLMLASVLGLFVFSGGGRGSCARYDICDED